MAALTLLTRGWRLGLPATYVYDEIYYAPSAADLLAGGVDRTGTVHPPMGPWVLAAGVRIGGYDALGWRLGAVVAGVAVVVGTYALALLVTRRRPAATVAGLLVVVDGLALVTSRLALLDGILTAFWVATAWCTVHAWLHPNDSRTLRRDTWLAALALGGAVATKWSGAALLPIVAVTFGRLAWRRWPPGGPRARQVAATLAIVFLVPVGIYVAGYLPRLAAPDDGGVASWVDDQVAMARFHRDLRPRTSGAHPAWTWATQHEPTVLFAKECRPALGLAPDGSSDGICPARPDTTTARILAVANPVVWFAGLASAPVLAWRAVARGDRVARLLLAFGAAVWIPWLLGPREALSFYAAALVPFLALWTVSARWPRPLVAGILVAATAAAVWLWPLWTAIPLDPAAAHARAWLLPGG
ncbi:MAG: phospholipid carrier-dependent glycosyltransferase [Acidimicrobiales bacterium]|nr:phospholipid carrier-dependent glycosyltransferase [Acidimicrobiales bacterium]